MSLRNINLNKVMGREAMLQGQWTITTSDGHTHAVWAGLKSALLGAKLTITVNDAPLVDTRKMIIAGELATFELGGDVFALRHTGMGLLGGLRLMQNGRDLSASPVPAPPSRTHLPDTPVQASPPATEDTGTWETWIEEAERFTEPLGEEVRVIDNARSNSPTERKITVSRQWSQTVSLDMEKATEIGGNVTAKLPWTIGFSASAKRSVKRKYAVSEGVTRTYSEEVTINVLPNTRSTVTFMWRQVWQRGVVVGRDAQGKELRAPFEVKLHPTFDQRQEDVKTAPE